MSGEWRGKAGPDRDRQEECRARAVGQVRWQGVRKEMKVRLESGYAGQRRGAQVLWGSAPSLGRRPLLKR